MAVGPVSPEGSLPAQPGSLPAQAPEASPAGAVGTPRPEGGSTEKPWGFWEKPISDAEPMWKLMGGTPPATGAVAEMEGFIRRQAETTQIGEDFVRRYQQWIMGAKTPGEAASRAAQAGVVEGVRQEAGVPDTAVLPPDQRGLVTRILSIFERPEFKQLFERSQGSGQPAAPDTAPQTPPPAPPAPGGNTTGK